MLHLTVIAEDPRQGIRHSSHKRVPSAILHNTVDKKNLVRMHLYTAVEEIIGELFKNGGSQL